MPPAPSEVPGRPDLEPNADESFDVFEDEGIVVKAAPIRHLVPCIGYVVAEKKSRVRLRPEVIDPIISRNAQRLADITEWPQLRGEPKAVYRLLLELERGGTFTFPDGTHVSPADVFTEAKQPRKICFAFDTCDPSLLTPLALGSDLLVHEATMSGAKGTSSKSDGPADEAFLPKEKRHTAAREDRGVGVEERNRKAKDLMGPTVQAASDAAFERGHSSAAMAGSFAASIGASRLLLTHFSQRDRGDAALRSVLTMERVEEEARRAYEIERQLQRPSCAKSQLKVTAAWDGLSVFLPQRPSSSTAGDLDEVWGDSAT